MVQLPSANAYLGRLGLTANPFPVAPDASRYFLTRPLEALVYETLFCIQQRKGFIVITGEVGLGKTTFSRYLFRQLDDGNTSVAIVFNSVLQTGELLEQICQDFGLRPEGTASEARPLREQINQLNEFFINEKRNGRNCVIFIDDAQNLNIQSLEAIRVLSNLETDTEKLVQVVLLGQQELQDQLNREELRQLRSRIALFREIRPLQEDELTRYIEYKLSITSDGKPIALTPAAARGIYQSSGGNLRRANMLLDRALIGMLGNPERIVNLQLIKAAMEDLDPPVRRPSRSAKGTGRGSGRVAAVGLSAVIIALGLAGGWFYLAGDLQRWYADLTEEVSSLTMAEEAAATHADVAGLLLPDPLPEPPADAAPALAEEEPDVPEPMAIAMLPESGAATQPLPEVSDEEAERNRERVLDYLARLDLQDHVGLVLAALVSGRSGELEREVLAPRGFMLHRGGAELTELSRPALTLSADRENSEHWVIWRPDFRVELMEYGREGEGIRRLQQRLAAAGLYDGAIDGISGPLTFSSLIEFQREHGLPGTGQVDDTTLLWLHEYEDAVP